MCRRLHSTGAGTPPGWLYHVCYRAPDNLQVIDLYDSPAAPESFGRTLLAILQEMGIEARPKVQPVHNTVNGEDR